MPVLILHAIFVVNFFLWLAFAPQYRFILPVYVFYVAWCVWRWTKPLIEKRIRYRVQLLPLMTIAVLFLVSLIPISFEIRSTSRHLARNDGFSFNTLFKPHVSYTFPGLDSLSAGGQQYYHVKRNIYCWDSPLPCMSESYYRFLQDQGYEIFGAADRREFVLRTVGSGGVEE